MSAPLYNSAILRLAASIPHTTRLSDPAATVEKRSPVCGSRVTVDVTLDDLPPAIGTNRLNRGTIHLDCHPCLEAGRLEPEIKPACAGVEADSLH